MTTLMEAKIQPGGFAAVLETEDFAAYAEDPGRFAELQALLDKHLVVHAKPARPLSRESVGRMAYRLGYPTDPAMRPKLRPGAPVGPEGEFSFVADFGSKADTSGRPAPPTSYIESLHQDGISAYSVSAVFNVSPLNPQEFVDLRAAYQGLPRDLKAIVETRHALHAGMATPRTPYAELPAYDEDSASRRPMVVKHARTGEALLHLPKNPASRIEGLDEADSARVIAALWAHCEALPARYAAIPQHNEMIVWDGMGALHTNPAYPRDRDRTVWFFIIPSKLPALEPVFG
jgi:hypothetical protein